LYRLFLIILPIIQLGGKITTFLGNSQKIS